VEANRFFEDFKLDGLVPPVDPIKLAAQEKQLLADFLSFPKKACRIIVVNSQPSINFMAQVLGFMNKEVRSYWNHEEHVNSLSLQDIYTFTAKNELKLTQLSKQLPNRVLRKWIASEGSKFRNVIGLDTEWKPTSQRGGFGADILQVSVLRFDFVVIQIL
jgi:hypothetical protein